MPTQFQGLFVFSIYLAFESDTQMIENRQGGLIKPRVGDDVARFCLNDHHMSLRDDEFYKEMKKRTVLYC